VSAIAFEEAIGGFRTGEGHFRGGAMRGREFFAMGVFAGFAEEDGFDLATGFQGFLGPGGGPSDGRTLPVSVFAKAAAEGDGRNCLSPSDCPRLGDGVWRRLRKDWARPGFLGWGAIEGRG